jgi:acyl-CoA thioesterase
VDEKIKKAIFRQVAKEPFAKKFGLKLIDLDAGYSRVEMVFTPDMENIFGMAHGGALFALLDEAFETASNSHGTMAVALNMNTSYLAAPSPGATLTAEAKELNRTRKTAVYDIKVTDDTNCLIASCQALVYRMEKPLPFLEAAPGKST